ncbi:hypothetical protein BH24CHL6_BH24CHL6_06680 [soil metagenome]
MWLMKAINSADLEFTLHCAEVEAVSVRLRRFGERWVAEAGDGGRVGVGLTPRAALAASVQPLGTVATGQLLSDLCLLGPSIEILKMEQTAG